MSVGEVLGVLFVTVTMGGVLVMASLADQRQSDLLRRITFTGIVGLNVGIVLVGLLPVIGAYAGAGDEFGIASPAAAWRGFALAVILGGIGMGMLIRRVRLWAARIFPPFNPMYDAPAVSAASEVTDRIPSLQPGTTGEPLFPQMLNYYTTATTAEGAAGLAPGSVSPGVAVPHPERTYRVRGFNPDSAVHLAALYLLLLMLSSQLITFAAGGGLEGMAQNFEEQGLSVGSLLVNSLPFIVLSLLGVGLGLRRNWSETLARLGLGPVTVRGFLTSLKLTFVLLVGLVIVGMLWMALVSETVYEEQTQASEALSRSVTSIGLAVVLAVTAAVGEEIAFRGALQPVFGLWPTAIVFALTHTQYALTPAWLIILGVAIAFGWIRERHNTTVAILTHFWYNLFQLLLLFVVPEEATQSLIRLFG